MPTAACQLTLGASWTHMLRDRKLKHSESPFFTKLLLRESLLSAFTPSSFVTAEEGEA